MFPTLLHYSLHFIFPVILAFIVYPTKWKKIALVWLATMAVDLDHLLADPIFDPHRCSINFHPLHSHYAIVLYGIFLLIPGWIRIVGIGLLMHMITDTLDCYLSSN